MYARNKVKVSSFSVITSFRRSFKKKTPCEKTVYLFFKLCNSAVLMVVNNFARLIDGSEKKTKPMFKLFLP